MTEEKEVAEAAVALLDLGRDDAVAFDCVAFRSVSLGVQRRLIGRLVQALGGGDHPPRRDRLERALVRLKGNQTGENPAAPVILRCQIANS